MEPNDKPTESPGQGLGQAVVPPRKPSSNGKWYAVILVLIVVIAALLVLYATKTPSGPSGTSASVTGAQAVTSVGQPFVFNITANGQFNNITVWYGDGTTQLLNYSNSNTVTVTHTYSAQGDYYIYYVINYGSSTSNGLVPVSVGFAGAFDSNLSYGFAQLIANSTAPVSTNPILFGPGANLTYQVSYSTPSNDSMQVVNLTVNLYQGANLIQQHAYPLVYSPKAGGYQLPQGVIDLYLNGLTTGFYTVQMYVTTGSLETQTVTIPVTLENTASVVSTGTVYYNQTSYMQDGSYLNFTPILEYTTGASVHNVVNTNLTYMSNTNVTYSGAAPAFAYPNMTMLTLQKDSTLTFLGDTNISVATDTNLTEGSPSRSFQLNASVVHAETANNATTFKNATTVTIWNATNVELTTVPSVNYSAGQAMEFLTAGVATNYNENTTLTYTNVTNWVIYPSSTYVNVTNKVETSVSQVVNTGGAVVNATADTSVSYLNIPIFSKVTPYQAAGVSTFINGEDNAPGGYTSLDPAIAFYTASNEIIMNTIMQLDQYNGTSTTNFYPELAAYLPTVANGGVNTNAYNYTVTTKNATGASFSFQQYVLPFENFTYHIRSGIKDQFGQSITAYDVWYQILRDQLFINSSPGTGGYLIGSFFANASFNPTYANLMPNLSYNEATNNFTIHFSQPMPLDLVYQLFAASGTWVENASWLIQHGAGIQFTPQGFVNYTAQGNLAGYNTYIQNHIAATGPYEVSLISPAQFVVLTANPNFQSPGSFYPAAGSVKTVILQYLNSPNTAYLELKSGVATAAAIPTSMWNDVLALQKAGTVNINNFNTLGIFFYNFNAQINESMMHTFDSAANVPQNFFMNPNVREAFAYAYNYSYYYDYQIGNAIYNTSFFVPYAGMIVPGLPFSQNISELNATGATVPYTDITIAQQYWNNFMNSNAADGAAAMGITGGSSPVFKGNSLRIPIFIPQNDPADAAGATTWGQMLAKVIPNVKVDVVQTTLTNIFASLAVPGQNPMAINWGGWAPDYPYPTDYLSAMSMPISTSTYLNANSYNVSYFMGQHTARYGQTTITNTTEAGIFQQMITDYNKGQANETNNTKAAFWFHKVNEQAVNMSFQVYIGQQNLQYITNSIVNTTAFAKYQENVMIGGGQELQYNFIVFDQKTS